MKSSGSDLRFPALAGREVVARFDGGPLTSDAGLVWVAQADRKLGVTEALAGGIVDRRQAGKVKHRLEEILRERVYALLAGYPDANDLTYLREDPALQVACGQRPGEESRLASQPTVSRFENGVGSKEALRMGLGLAERVMAQLPEEARAVTLDVDATDDECHGQQEGEAFNAYYDEHWYLPLYRHVTDGQGRQRLLGTLLRPGNAAATKGLFGLLWRAVKRLRRRFPEVQLLLRADSGFGVASVMAWCEAHGIDYLLGLRSNQRLQTLSTPIQMDAALTYRWAGDGCKEYGEFRYKAGSWPKKRRVIVQAEIPRGALNPRYVVTNLEGDPEDLYERYCVRGDRENRTKAMKLGLDSGRTSCHRFGANQGRLLLATAACVGMSLRQERLQGTRWATAQVATVRLRLLKVGTSIMTTCRKMGVHLPMAYPDQDPWEQLFRKLLPGQT
ncbi:MAG: IS1380 family transposase [Armatimonadetes bacterium]|nr:IS1380 family transposase [Armatimonadota bacterium]